MLAMLGLLCMLSLLQLLSLLVFPFQIRYIKLLIYEQCLRHWHTLQFMAWQLTFQLSANHMAPMPAIAFLLFVCVLAHTTAAR